MTYNVHVISNLCYVFDTALFCMEVQGCNAAPSLDVQLLMQQFFTASVSNQRSDQAFRYAYCQHPPLLQPEFLPLKLADWIAKNLAEELNLPDPGHEWSSGDLTRILTRCLVQTDGAITYTHSTLLSSNLICITESCGHGVIRSTWPSITFMAKM